MASLRVLMLNLEYPPLGGGAAPEAVYAEAIGAARVPDLAGGLAAPA